MMAPRETNMKHYLQFNDLSADEYTYLFERAALIKKKFKAYESTTRWSTAHWP